MRQHRRKRGIGNRQTDNVGIHATAFKQQGQQIANTTRQATDLYDDDGVARFTLRGWPMRGRYVGTFEPQAVTR